eukprot:CAMPEP_0113620178 /NCGR_PEP_ID=MMETSP0017_2-20120614/10272_1 /TAXON_ID=2856 /ORGANISM="Cylindrotheca closterium" /LENGTH=453 /DNA_ID=CAMNT_0000529817 /DNA_START=399 /DNA_END=1761 /DNA_ORIENTATION=+ /assembly_acc=CAM_ASM_000147
MSDFENVLATKLDHHGLTSEQSQTYLNLGVTPFIVVRLTMDNYYDLLMRLRQYTLNCEGGWDQWKVHLEHHSKKLGLICQLSPSRTNCLLNTYIYLQDQEKSSFMSSGLQSKINKAAIQEQQGRIRAIDESTTGDRRRAETAGTQTKHSCSHCHSNLHYGGKAKCLFKDVSGTKAPTQAKEAEKQLRTNPGKCLNDIISALGGAAVMVDSLVLNTVAMTIVGAIQDATRAKKARKKQPNRVVMTKRGSGGFVKKKSQIDDQYLADQEKKNENARQKRVDKVVTRLEKMAESEARMKKNKRKAWNRHGNLVLEPTKRGRGSNPHPTGQDLTLMFTIFEISFPKPPNNNAKSRLEVLKSQGITKTTFTARRLFLKQESSFLKQEYKRLTEGTQYESDDDNDVEDDSDETSSDEDIEEDAKDSDEAVDESSEEPDFCSESSDDEDDSSLDENYDDS